MDDSPCLRFFVQPTATLQRRYEVLRAFFVEHRSRQSIAQQLGYSYETVDSLIRDFRAQCRAGQIPPFLSSHAGGDPPTMTAADNRLTLKNLPPPTVAK